VALLSALHAIATGGFQTGPTTAYDDLPENRGIDYNLLVAGGRLVLPSADPIRADVAIRFEDSAARTGATWGEIGDLDDAQAVDTIRADGLYLHAVPDEGGAIRRGGAACFAVRRGPEPDSEFVWRQPCESELSDRRPDAND
jgi:hypothetical protein